MSGTTERQLTSRQAEILAFIRDYSRHNGFPPSVRDIGKEFGLYPATVHDHLRALERKGRLRRDAHKSRSLALVETRPRRRPAEKTDAEVPRARPLASTEVATAVDVPLVGRVAAGKPILAEENVEEIVRLPEGWARPGAFLLRVEGDSMTGAHILDGDYVLVRPQKSASNGEVVVALIQDEATVKRFYRSGERIELRAENPAFPTIQVAASEAAAFGIVGKVVGVFRLG